MNKPFYLRGLLLSALVSTWPACHASPPPKSPTEALFQQRCGNCHDLPKPTDYSDRDWQRVVAQMAGNAGLSEAQAQELLTWLRANNDVAQRQ
ncbi:MAG: hypothetical protein QM784_32125 [Polyangiaceae bacterium]